MHLLGCFTTGFAARGPVDRTAQIQANELGGSRAISRLPIERGPSPETAAPHIPRASARPAGGVQHADPVGFSSQIVRPPS